VADQLYLKAASQSNSYLHHDSFLLVASILAVSMESELPPFIRAPWCVVKCAGCRLDQKENLPFFRCKMLGESAFLVINNGEKT
jgi:hypothetical protein